MFCTWNVPCTRCVTGRSQGTPCTHPCLEPPVPPAGHPPEVVAWSSPGGKSTWGERWGPRGAGSGPELASSEAGRSSPRPRCRRATTCGRRPLAVCARFSFPICLSVLACRERRINPDCAGTGGRAVLKVQNLPSVRPPGTGAGSLRDHVPLLPRGGPGGHTPTCRGCLQPQASVPSVRKPGGTQGTLAVHQRPPQVSASGMRAQVAGNFPDWLFWDFSYKDRPLCK